MHTHSKKDQTRGRYTDFNNYCYMSVFENLLWKNEFADFNEKGIHVYVQRFEIGFIRKRLSFFLKYFPAFFWIILVNQSVVQKSSNFSKIRKNLPNYNPTKSSHSILHYEFLNILNSLKKFQCCVWEGKNSRRKYILDGYSVSYLFSSINQQV